jgi:hypothetical protein
VPPPLTPYESRHKRRRYLRQKKVASAGSPVSVVAAVYCLTLLFLLFSGFGLPLMPPVFLS